MVESNGGILSFNTLDATITTLSPVERRYTVQLRGETEQNLSGDDSYSAKFEWREKQASEWNEINLGDEITEETKTFEETLEETTDITFGADYEYRLVVNDDPGTIVDFSLASIQPETREASQIQRDSFVINGFIGQEGSEEVFDGTVSASFFWRELGAAEFNEEFLGDSFSEEQEVSQEITGLTEDTTYEYYLQADGEQGDTLTQQTVNPVESDGGINSFSTSFFSRIELNKPENDESFALGEEDAIDFEFTVEHEEDRNSTISLYLNDSVVATFNQSGAVTETYTHTETDLETGEDYEWFVEVSDDDSTDTDTSETRIFIIGGIDFALTSPGDLSELSYLEREVDMTYSVRNDQGGTVNLYINNELVASDTFQGTGEFEEIVNTVLFEPEENIEWYLEAELEDSDGNTVRDESDTQTFTVLDPVTEASLLNPADNISQVKRVLTFEHELNIQSEGFVDLVVDGEVVDVVNTPQQGGVAFEVTLDDLDRDAVQKTWYVRYTDESGHAANFDTESRSFEVRSFPVKKSTQRL